MTPTKHKFMLEMHTADGDVLGRTPVEMDWQPAFEFAHFQAIREGRLPAVTVSPPSAIEPVWDSKSGQPFISGVLVVLDAADGEPCSAVVHTDYFNAAARDASAQYVEDGRLKAGETFRYRVTAFAVDAPPPETPPGPGLEMEAVAQPLSIIDTPLSEFLDKAVLVGQNDPDDVPVFVPHELVEQARALVNEAGDLETGGVLLGRLHRDTLHRDVIFIELTAQIPARHTRREATKLTFTPETWAAAQAVLDLRGAGESIEGWWHSHPNWCRDCDPQRQKVCPLGGIFFSADDVSVQRTVFFRAHHLGLLLTNRSAGIVPSLFGWRRGTVASRAFHMLGVPDHAGGHLPEVTATVGGTERAHD